MRIICDDWRGRTTLTVDEAVKAVAEGQTGYYSRGYDEAIEKAENTRNFTVRLATLLIEKGVFTPAEVKALLGSGYEVQL